MIRYVPFLKAKQNELNAMSELAPAVKQAISPFFDFPRKQDPYDPEQYADTARRIAKSLKKHWGTEAEFYFDDLDIGQKLEVEGEQRYAYVLGTLHELRVIPVVGIGRSTHNAAVAQLKQDGAIDANTVAFRAVEDDFEDFEVVKGRDRKKALGEGIRWLSKRSDLRLRLSPSVPGKERGPEGPNISRAFFKNFCATYPAPPGIGTGFALPALKKKSWPLTETGSSFGRKFA